MLSTYRVKEVVTRSSVCNLSPMQNTSTELYRSESLKLKCYDCDSNETSETDDRIEIRDRKHQSMIKVTVTNFSIRSINFKSLYVFSGSS